MFANNEFATYLYICTVKQKRVQYEEDTFICYCDCRDMLDE